jgi:hypothetical protein
MYTSLLGKNQIKESTGQGGESGTGGEPPLRFVTAARPTNVPIHKHYFTTGEGQSFREH